MQELANELRASCEGAPELSVVVMLNLFGIRRAGRLRSMPIKALARISELAGLSGSHGHEIRKGVNLSDFVSPKDERDPDCVFVRKLTSVTDDEMKLMGKRLKVVCDAAPLNTLIATLSLFGVENFNNLEPYTTNDLGKLCTLAGLRPMRGYEIRRGQRLATYVDFRNYPTQAMGKRRPVDDIAVQTATAL